MEYFNYLGSMITKDAIGKREIESRFAMAKLLKQERSFHLLIGEATSKLLHLNIILYGAETWALRNVDKKYVESSEMWSWRRMQKLS